MLQTKDTCQRPWPVSPSASSWEPPLCQTPLCETEDQREEGMGLWPVSHGVSPPTLALGLQVVAPSDPECCSQVLPCYHKLFRALALVDRAGLVLGCRGSGYLPGEGPPQEPAALQLGRRTTWQGWAHGRCQSFHNGGLQPPNTSFRAAVTKARLTPWLWAEAAGAGRGGEVVWKALPGRSGKGWGLASV